MNVPILYEHQQKALPKIKNGSILNGGVGSGKSRTSLCYYILQMGGVVDGIYDRNVKCLKPKDLFIITTAQKRDKLEWVFEIDNLKMVNRTYDKLFSSINIIIDSWNNIKKYQKIYDAFFIFDEDRVTGYGTWVKAFLKIAKKNSWIILSATPGDIWTDYIPVFVANGFYKNKTDFNSQHVVYKRFCTYPAIDRFVGIKKLERLRSEILIDMEFERSTVPHHINIVCDYDKTIHKILWKDRWNIWENKPIDTASELYYLMRKNANSHKSRGREVRKIAKQKGRVIIFYNFDYELEILKSYDYGDGFIIAEWNGHKHEPLPTSDKWVYLVQYTSGCEGWNCITTDTIIFFSQSYSYKQTVQASGRTDRLNTPYRDLYYYHLTSASPIDLAIKKALNEKRDFNERKDSA